MYNKNLAIGWIVNIMTVSGMNLHELSQQIQSFLLLRFKSLEAGFERVDYLEYE